ncbi:hypothetical protein EON67_02335 [archaeon]|nr:MAG: hypothetical protein EON67_02335 [archaeon]
MALILVSQAGTAAALPPLVESYDGGVNSHGGLAETALPYIDTQVRCGLAARAWREARVLACAPPCSPIHVHVSARALRRAVGRARHARRGKCAHCGGDGSLHPT